MHIEVYQGVLRELGLSEETFLQGGGTVCPSEAVLKRFQIDTRYVYPDIAKWETNPAPKKTDLWGVKRRRMGYFYEIAPDGHPLARVQSVEELRDYPWPLASDIISKQTLERMIDRAEELARGDYAVVFPYGPLGGSFAFSMWLRGYEKFLADLPLRPKIAEAIMDRITDVLLEVIKRCVKPIGKHLDVIFIGDDLGTQHGPMISTQTYRTSVKPRHRRIVDALRNSSRARVILHTDGSIAPFIEDFAEIGIAGIDPVQVTAAGMDSRELKEKFGEKMVFWGGIDGQQVLPFGTVEDVRREVRRRIDDLGGRGGYILASVHNIIPPTPPRNVIAMFDEAVRYTAP